jgi:hypothetical protein
MLWLILLFAIVALIITHITRSSPLPTPISRESSANPPSSFRFGPWSFGFTTADGLASPITSPRYHPANHDL